MGYAYFEKEKVPYYIAFIVDLSEQKQAEAAIKEYAERMERLNTELERANRELQDFAFVASHDLQEPLRKIQAFGDRLASRLGSNLDDESRDYLIRMGNASQRMRLMINDLLALSRITTRGQPFEYVTLDEVVSEVISDLELRIESTGGQVEVGYLPSLQADPVQMHQLFQNLIVNALKFHKPDTNPEVHVFGECNTEQQKAIIYVKDNGIGFDEQYLDRIFQPFQRLNGMGQYEGSGIGLAVCRKIVERHNGTITAHSQPGEGSTFIITLPMSAAKK
jgi:light-regulated signal transduction histidine kinase (bacteriophytochrome)